jgi:hypothetical protein
MLPIYMLLFPFETRDALITGFQFPLLVPFGLDEFPLTLNTRLDQLLQGQTCPLFPRSFRS